MIRGGGGQEGRARPQAGMGMLANDYYNNFKGA